MTDQLTRIEKAVERIEHALFTGNGEPPVLSRLSVLEERTGGVASKKFVAGMGSVVAAVVVIANFIQSIRQASGQ